MKKILFLSFLILLFGLANAGVKDTVTGIEFSYEAPNAQAVYLAGDFNEWNTTGTPLSKDKNGVWKTVLKLAPGKYQYKFVVDGNWLFDQDNPNLADDGYGGSNSVVEIGVNGKIAAASKKAISVGIKSTFNPKVYFTGRYYTLNRFLKNDTDNFMLEKPEHDLNFGLKIKFNSKFEGLTVMNINNNAEGSDMWKTHLNYKRTYLKLKADFFRLDAFDNFGTVTSPDPLHIIGDEGKYHYDFGYGFRGIYAETTEMISDKIFNGLPVQLNGKVLYADESGDNDGDRSFARISLKNNLSSNNNDRFDLNWGLSVFGAEIPTGDIVQKHLSRAVDFTVDKNIFQNGWINPMNVQLNGEFLHFTNKNEFKNFGSDSLIVKKDFQWMNGTEIFAGSKISLPAVLSFYFNYRKTEINFIIETGTDTLQITPSPYTISKDLARNKFTCGADFETKTLTSNLELQYWKTSFPDTLVTWADYYKYLEKTDGNGRWFQKYSEIPFSNYTLLGYKTGLIWKADFLLHLKIAGFNTEIGMKNTFAHQDFMKVPKYFESLFTTKFDFSKNWSFYTDTRFPYYNDDILGLKTDFKNGNDLFISNYSEISYHLFKNVKLALGWGVNPVVINGVTDEFYAGGREEFLENADNFAEYVESTYRGLGEKIRNAERQLRDEKRLTLEAVVTF